jgi:hypothetical protein
LLVSENDKSDFAACQVLLVPNVLIGQSAEAQNPLASATAISSPLTSLPHPRSIASTTT